VKNKSLGNSIFVYVALLLGVLKTESHLKIHQLYGSGLKAIQIDFFWQY